MTIVDISRLLDDATAVYDGDDPIALTALCDIGDSAPCRITGLAGLTTHTLTHVDVPRHFITDGDTLSDVPLDRFWLKALVVDVDGPSIESKHVPERLDGRALLFRTTNSQLDPSVFHRDHVAVDAGAVGAIVASGASLVGIDYLSVDRFGDEDYPAHRGLLGAGVLILEGLDLSNAPPGECELVALPLNVADGDGSPVRAVLRYP